jgi:hypothetical protein
MEIGVAHHNSRAAATPAATVVDVTSRGPHPWVRFSPFYPHGGIPVPLSPGVTGTSVEAIWQALKVFESAGVDRALLRTTRMTGLKRTVRRYGPVLGHRAGLDAPDGPGGPDGPDALDGPDTPGGPDKPDTPDGSGGPGLLDYEAARRRIYLPAYHHVLRHHLTTEVAQLRRLAEAGPVILLDYTTNGDVSDLSSPLSHAALIRLHLLDEWPGG